ncbi:MAG: terminase large subunit [Lachnospiraceae bacterium]|nr:terminase large subunit [Lachnospiraceae bacterium]
MEDYILTYYQQIKDGRVTVGKWILLLYEYIIKGLEDGLFFYDIKKAHRKIRWIEKHTHHVKGKWAPKTIKLELWQKAAISVMFGIVDKDGNRQFREVFMLMGRKCGKSTMADGVIGDMMYDDDEYGADVYCCAPKVDQADIVYDAFWRSVLLDPELSAITKPRKGDKYVEETNSAIQKVPFTAKTADGYNPHLVVCDEIAAWAGDKGLKQYEVMASALGSREQPMIFSITTAGYISDGIFDELMKRSTRVLLGDSKETRLLPFLYMIDDVSKWNDLNELKKSMPNLGVSVSVDFMLEEIAKAEGSLSKKAEFLCKYCNIKQNSSLAWLPAQTIEEISGKPLEIEDFRGCYCVAGIDLSQTTDLTAGVIVVEKGGILNVFAHFWMPSEKMEQRTAEDGVPYQAYIQRGFLSLSGENFVDYNDVKEWLDSMVRDYELYPLRVGYDRYSSQYLIKDLEATGYQVSDVYQGDNLWPVLLEMEGLIKDEKIHIGDNDLLKSHLLNAALKMSMERGRGRLVKINQRARIDGVAALADAMTVRQHDYAEIGYQLRNEE